MFGLSNGTEGAEFSFVTAMEISAVDVSKRGSSSRCLEFRQLNSRSLSRPCLTEHWCRGQMNIPFPRFRWPNEKMPLEGSPLCHKGPIIKLTIFFNALPHAVRPSEPSIKNLPLQYLFTNIFIYLCRHFNDSHCTNYLKSPA